MQILLKTLVYEIIRVTLLCKRGKFPIRTDSQGNSPCATFLVGHLLSFDIGVMSLFLVSEGNSHACVRRKVCPSCEFSAQRSRDKNCASPVKIHLSTIVKRGSGGGIKVGHETGACVGNSCLAGKFQI